ncbi:MAG: PRC-barrel domain-containing protein [Thermoplasmata archaeon]|nr:PRC-barrel domain-containing protein [Thermoplasmata archaeon]
MLVEMTELLGRQIYTPDGRLLGEVGNVVVDVEGSKIDGLYVDESSPLLVDESRPVNVPYRWVSAVNDVVLLKYFPRRVSLKKVSTRAAAASASSAAPPPPVPAR